MKKTHTLAVLGFAFHAAIALAQAPQPQAPTFRLGDAATPTAYDVRLAIDPDQPRFEGEAHIVMQVNRATPVVWMNARGLEIVDATFEQAGKRKTATATLANEEFVGFAVEGGFAAGDATATIRWRGNAEERATRGLFRQRDGKQWYVLTQLESINARRMMPCFDEPGWKTPWRITLDTPASARAFANTPEQGIGEIANRPNWKRHVFATTKPLPTYLVAFAVGPFDVLEGGLAGRNRTPLRYITPQGRASEARWAKESTPKVLSLIEDYFGSPYPFEKLDHASIPAAIGFGAMENVGLITYSSELLLSKPGRESLDFRRGWASVAAHEMAHQWFGDLVTLAFWNDIWLNESFATWTAAKAMKAFKPEWQGGWRSGVGRRRAIASDRLMSARRIANPVENNNDIASAFDGITYAKGSVVLSMFEEWLGEERFRAGVRKFLADHAYASATSTDFFRALGEAAGRGDEAVAAFRTFIEQPGLPLVDVKLRCEAGSATLDLDQHRLVPKGTEGPDGKWTTPACFRIGANGKALKQCTEIRGAQSLKLDVAGCPDYVIGNAGGAGHWVPRYDKPTFERLVHRLPMLPVEEAVALGDGTAMMLGSGLIAPHDALIVARGLLAHKSAGVQHVGVTILKDTREEFLAPDDLALFREIESRSVVPLARRVGWTPRPNESLDTQDLRETLLPHAAMRGGDKAGALEVRRLALRWLADPASIDASIGEKLMRTAGHFADADLFDRMVARLATITERRDRVALLEALAVVREPALRDRMQALVVEDARIESRDVGTYLATALDDRINGEATLRFASANWQRLGSKLPIESGTGTRFFRASQGYCTREAREALVAFGPKLQVLEGGPKVYAQLMESVDICVATWRR